MLVFQQLFITQFAFFCRLNNNEKYKEKMIEISSIKGFGSELILATIFLKLK